MNDIHADYINYIISDHICMYVKLLQLCANIIFNFAIY